MWVQGLGPTSPSAASVWAAVWATVSLALLAPHMHTCSTAASSGVMAANNWSRCATIM